MRAGGAVGELLAAVLITDFNRTGAYIVVATALFVSLILATQFSFATFLHAAAGALERAPADAAHRLDPLPGDAAEGADAPRGDPQAHEGGDRGQRQPASGAPREGAERPGRGRGGRGGDAEARGSAPPSSRCPSWPPVPRSWASLRTSRPEPLARSARPRPWFRSPAALRCCLPTRSWTRRTPRVVVDNERLYEQRPHPPVEVRGVRRARHREGDPPGARGHHLRVQAGRGNQVLEDRGARRRPGARPRGGEHPRRPGERQGERGDRDPERGAGHDLPAGDPGVGGVPQVPGQAHARPRQDRERRRLRHRPRDHAPPPDRRLHGNREERGPQLHDREHPLPVQPGRGPPHPHRPQAPGARRLR